MEISRNFEAAEIHFTQKKYINDVIERFIMTNCNVSDIPMTTEYILESESTDTNRQEIIAKPLANRVESLMFLAVCSRLDICHAMTRLTRRMKNPLQADWIAAKRVLRYLKGTIDTGLRLNGRA